ncbi:MAG: carboxypeptidase regulatory-like domain-containing protein, partial [Gemmatimonadota bacterium]
GRPIPYVGITVFDTLGTRVAATATSLGGTYALALPEEGVFNLSVAAIGYSKETRGPLEIPDGESVVVDLELEPSAITLPGIVVEVERARIDKYLTGQGFYQRSRTAGGGYFFFPEDIEKIDPFDLQDLVSRVPGVWYEWSWRGSSLTCISHGTSRTPRVYLDGIKVSASELDLLAPVRSIAAMEIYRGGASLPVEFSATGSDRESSCVVLIWSKG